MLGNASGGTPIYPLLPDALYHPSKNSARVTVHMNLMPGPPLLEKETTLYVTQLQLGVMAYACYPALGRLR